MLITLSKYLLSCETEEIFSRFISRKLGRNYFGRRQNLPICPINRQNFITMNKYLNVFFNINTTFNFVHFTFAVISFKCQVKCLYQTASLRLPFDLLKSNDESNFSKNSSKVLYHL